MDKGTRVTIIGGRQGKGVAGEIFWTGENRFGSGKRYGVRGDDGQTYWVNGEDVEAGGAAPPPAAPAAPGRSYAKGDRVTWRQRGKEGTGAVFWLGESKRGGQRLGVRDDETEEAIWIDAHEVTPLEDEAPRRAPPRGRAPRDDEPEAMPEELWAAPLGVDDVPPPAPFDDDVVDAWAAQLDDEPDDGGWDE